MNPTEPVPEDPILSVSDLSVGFEGFDGYADVVDGVDLSVGRGEVVTVVGETGCGKSVTTKAVTGLLDEPPANVSGTVAFEGTDLSTLSADERRALNGDRMGMVFQDPMSSLNPVFTVGEQLVDTLQFGGEGSAGVVEYLRRRYSRSDRADARERVLDMLREVQMPDPESVMDSYPSELSGGMCQRALVAQALLNEPDLLIADEPGTALDVTVHDQILALLSELIEDRDMSILMITHNLGVARQLSDRVYIMYGGRIVETGTTEEIFEDPKHPYTQGLIASIPQLSGGTMADGIDGSVPEYTDPPEGCRFHPRCPYADEACRTERPAFESFGDARGVECVRFASGDPGPEPTLGETKRRLNTAVDPTDAAADGGTTDRAETDGGTVGEGGER
ncbi:peptide ABC transporter ATPase [Halosimplex carlsbadense 2-9-1]|uniref:Nickel import system ATP-binding protein NikD n=1 Tax=Halosimplex carlsbadense 2-9-1 TaxID=797114 RepID=M0D8T4_9EURY|nr:ABC transporter ATP-binding protein [Halosimplex carlsbadense]ELZ30549.1 peptide ABC transporter ATPase [Halosimplex carlsbadense 2-9-1]